MSLSTHCLFGCASLLAMSCLRTDIGVNGGTTGEEEMSSESTDVEGECGDGVDEGEGCDGGNHLQAAILVDANGVDIGDANAWTNTVSDGRQQSSEHGADWSTNDGDQDGYTGRSKVDVLSGDWTVSQAVGCNFGARLCCVQVG